MPQDEDRVFDVSKPHKTGADATSRPVIVGHHPQMPDPMVNDHRPAEPEHLPDEPKQPVSGSSLENSPPENAQPGHLTIPVQDGEPQHAPLMEHHMEAKEPALAPAPILAAGSAPAVPATELTPASEPTPADNPASGLGSIYPQHDGNQPEQTPPVAGGAPVPVSAAAAVVPGPPMDDLPLPSHHANHGGHTHAPHPGKQGRDSSKMLWILAILIFLLGAYAIADATTSIMPVHIFKKSSPPATQTTVNTPASTTPTPSIPSGFKVYTVSGANASFDYLTAWGTPTVTTDPGFTQRGGDNKSDGTYAYLVDFATNKDVEVVFTSPKFLPVSRAPLYYDYLQVCIGTNDGKFYKSSLHFTTSNGVDTPSTITCDQGPLLDATKLGASTIVQLNTKAPDGSALGDLYTENLTGTNLNVVRVKDASMTNSASIKTLLGSIELAAASNTGSSQ